MGYSSVLDQTSQCNVSACVILTTPEMFSHFRMVSYISMLRVDFVLIVVAEEKVQTTKRNWEQTLIEQKLGEEK